MLFVRLGGKLLEKYKKEAHKMPLLDYKCLKCGKKFSELVKNYSQEVKCPDCGEIAERNYSGEVVGGLGKKTSSCTGNCSTCSGCSR